LLVPQFSFDRAERTSASLECSFAEFCGIEGNLAFAPGLDIVAAGASGLNSGRSATDESAAARLDDIAEPTTFVLVGLGLLLLGLLARKNRGPTP
jgi:hypothetical protein